MSEPRESWLRSPNHDRWAAAMVKCQHAGGHCGADGYCHYEGECFEGIDPAVDRLRNRVEELEIELKEQAAVFEERISAIEARLCPVIVRKESGDV